MQTLSSICKYFDNLLEMSRVRDFSNNGLQIEGRAQVLKIAFAVDASQRTAEMAVAAGADMLFVHHGLSWGDGFQRLTGLDARRYRIFFKNDLSLFACHLPLDAHPVLGNNAVLCDILGVEERKSFCNVMGTDLGFWGRLPKPMTAAQVSDLIADAIPSASKLVLAAPGAEEKPLHTLGIVSGGGDDAVLECYQLGIDGLLTGEAEYKNINSIYETGLPVIVSGHYATETTGILAVMKKVAEDFKGELSVEFMDCPTGM